MQDYPGAEGYNALIEAIFAQAANDYRVKCRKWKAEDDTARKYERLAEDPDAPTYYKAKAENAEARRDAVANEMQIIERFFISPWGQLLGGGLDMVQVVNQIRKEFEIDKL